MCKNSLFKNFTGASKRGLKLALDCSVTPKGSDVKLALHCPVSSSDEAGVAVRDSSSFAIIEGSEQATRDGDWKPLKNSPR